MLGALGDVPQPVEVHVSAAVDSDDRAVANTGSRVDVTLDARPLDSAPAGSTIERLSSKMSLIAAQISSVVYGG